MSKSRVFCVKNKYLMKEWFISRSLCNTSLANNRFNRLIFKSENSFKLLSNVKRCPQLSPLVKNMSSTTQSLDVLTYERIADKTLDQLTQQLEDLIESNEELKDSDVSLNNGVLTLSLEGHGVYVINKQTPNKQIWFSSPISGPKRYDYVNNDWLYKRDGISLNKTLSLELSLILNIEINFKPFC